MTKPMTDEELAEAIVNADGDYEVLLNLIKSYAKDYAEMVIGERPRPYINGVYPNDGAVVDIDLENNKSESLKFIQENGKVILWNEQRERMQ